MLRVATNVKKLDGSRAIGTYIPATNPDGKANKVIKTVLEGNTFYGRAFVVNAWYVTAYEPIWDKTIRMSSASSILAKNRRISPACGREF